MGYRKLSFLQIKVQSKKCPICGSVGQKCYNRAGKEFCQRYFFHNGNQAPQVRWVILQYGP